MRALEERLHLTGDLPLVLARSDLRQVRLRAQCRQRHRVTVPLEARRSRAWPTVCIAQTLRTVALIGVRRAMSVSVAHHKFWAQICVSIERRRQDDDLSSLSGEADGRDVKSMVRGQLLVVSVDRSSAHRASRPSVELTLKPRLDSRREALPDGSQHHNDAPDRGTSRGSCTRGPRDLARKARSEQFDPA